MRKFFSFIVTCLFGVAAALALAVASPASAQTYDGRPLVIDPGPVVTNTEVTTGVMDLSYYKSMSCQFRNTGATRSVIATCLDKSGNTMFTYPTVSVTLDTTAKIDFEPDASLTTGAAISGQTTFPGLLCKRMKVSSAAAAGIANVVCVLRPSK